MSWLRKRAIYPAALAALSLFIAAGVSADAGVSGESAAAAGKWAGPLKSRNGSAIANGKVAFRVKGRSVRGFTATGAPVNCITDIMDPTGTQLEIRTIEVPKAKIKGNKFKRVYDVEQNGQTIGTITLDGKFSGAKKASGTLKYKSGGCIGDFRFNAKKS